MMEKEKRREESGDKRRKREVVTITVHAGNFLESINLGSFSHSPPIYF
jgi:hypothetical protein